MFCFCFFRTFAPIFHFKIRLFLLAGAQEYLFPQGAGYLNLASQLPTRVCRLQGGRSLTTKPTHRQTSFIETYNYFLLKF